MRESIPELITVYSFGADVDVDVDDDDGKYSSCELCMRITDTSTPTSDVGQSQRMAAQAAEWASCTVESSKWEITPTFKKIFVFGLVSSTSTSGLWTTVKFAK